MSITSVKGTFYKVEFSENVTTNGRGWWQNNTLNVVADSLDRAVVVFRTIHPDARLHVVRRASDGDEVLLDDLGEYALAALKRMST